jgi:hypothetical protein
MAQPLMPKATAVWLVESTTLTFKQIADFCGLHELEVQAIADGEVATGMHGIDPVAGGQITPEELERCQADPNAKLTMAKVDIPMPKARTRGARYTPVAKRLDKPDAIEWLMKTYPEIQDAQIAKLLGTTKPTIQAVRDRTHWNAQNIRPRSPVELGFCSLSELDGEIIRARRALQRAADRKARAERRAAREAEAAQREAEERAKRVIEEDARNQAALAAGRASEGTTAGETTGDSAASPAPAAETPPTEASKPDGESGQG